MSTNDELEPIEVLLIFKLLFTGEEPKLSDLKPGRTPAQRKRLVDKGFITLESKPGKRGSYVVLTDKAWQWASEHLDSPFSITLNASRALAGLLPKLKTLLDRHDIPLAELLAPTAKVPETDESQAINAPKPSPAGDLDARIEEAYLACSGGTKNVRVRLADLRPKLDTVPRAELDATLLRMQGEGLLVLYPNDDTLGLKPDDHEAAMDVSGFKRHIVYLKG